VARRLEPNAYYKYSTDFSMIHRASSETSPLAPLRQCMHFRFGSALKYVGKQRRSLYVTSSPPFTLNPPSEMRCNLIYQQQRLCLSQRFSEKLGILGMKISW